MRMPDREVNLFPGRRVQESMRSADIDLEDRALLEDFRSGNELAFEALVMRYRQELLHAAQAILRHAQDAEDVCQAALLKLYERSGQYRGEAPVRVWLRRLTVSTCLDHLRRRRVRAFLLPWQDRAARSHASPDAGADGDARYAELRTQLDAILDRLPGRQRVIFSLRVLEEWSLLEIADSLAVDVGTVKTHLFRATRRVREKLAPATAPATGTHQPVPGGVR